MAGEYLGGIDWRAVRIGLYVATALLAYALAFIVFRARPARLQNRSLALILMTLGVTWTFFPLFELSGRSPAVDFAVQLIILVAIVTTPPLYLIFLSTLDTPFVAWIRRRRVRRVLGMAALLLPWWAILRPGQFMTMAGVDAEVELTLLANVAWGVWAAMGIFGIIVAVSLLRRSQPGSAARDQAGTYLAAFAVYDGGHIVSSLGSLIHGHPFWGNAFVALYMSTFALLLSYGILRHQLFDIDLRIKWTLSRGTVAAIFVASFFVVSELVAAILSDQIGLLAGVLVTGVLVFAMAPLQRLADRVSDAAMPAVRDTDEYRTVRKREVYRAAVEAALEDGTISERERSVLATLASELGLDPKEAYAQERIAAALARAAREDRVVPEGA